jgi:hypothetical protein
MSLTTATAWADALDALEERLRRQELVLAGSAETPAGEWMPAPGRVPDELIPRALALLERSQTMEVEVAAMVASARKAGAGRSSVNAYGAGGAVGAHL